MERLICSLSQKELGGFLSRQLNHFFPDRQPVRAGTLDKFLPDTLRRMGKIQGAIANRHAWLDEKPFFNHLNSDHYATFLYLISHRIGSEPKLRNLATKIFLLNKALHALDVYFEVQLPEIFLFAHPVGTVLGRAEYGNYFLVMQNCTVGNIDDCYPVLGHRVVLSSHSSVLGQSVLGDGVCVGAGSLLVNAKVAAHRTVVGRGKKIVVGRQRSEKWRNYFRDCP